MLIPYEGPGAGLSIQQMGRPGSGNITDQVLVDGTRAYYLRFRVGGQREIETLHERRGCSCGCGGGWTDRTAAIELENTLARVQAGVWRKRRDLVQVVDPREMPTFHVYASAWLESKIAGVLGDRPIDTNTENDYRWRLGRHLLPFFGEYRLDEIDSKLCVAFKAYKLREATELRAAIAAGAVLREANGRRQRPLVFRVASSFAHSGMHRRRLAVAGDPARTGRTCGIAGGRQARRGAW